MRASRVCGACFMATVVFVALCNLQRSLRNSNEFERHDTPAHLNWQEINAHLLEEQFKSWNASTHVERLIVDDVVAALTRTFATNNVKTVVIKGCNEAPVSIFSHFKADGIDHVCVDKVTKFTGIVTITRENVQSYLPHIMQMAWMTRNLDTLLMMGNIYISANGTVKRSAALDLKTSKRRVWFKSTNMYLDSFTRVYDTKHWGSEGGGSGDGSTLKATATLRTKLIQVISGYNIKSMLDTSCGSMLWMPLVLNETEKQVPGFQFHGTDVVCSLIKKHQKTFAWKANYKFSCVDYAHQKLPSGYDLVFSRDSLQHVPMHAAWQFLNNVRSSGAKFLLVGSYIKHHLPNFNIAPGDFYHVDLTKPPFNVRPKPLLIINEGLVDGKYMLLFDVHTLEWDDPLLGLE